ncbi:TetR/AcrR family transcriptional regulator [Rhodococcus sp. D2-41]|uniref:TetR/AcrR family transcriptional regulator n=1 Tax=Speluncibacter jeojiensis TaxID=2710754 RepID=A0A9X4RDA3_9ACTN|nr:TetR-like C-terminal domain-containing protein [Rhodococcus sp. D2-41]MDG3009760.1 TetR/AcrR family transcriptional regulator [Rhodococcus sp. D2-41]MDG3014509.1 TetR/AcrR family transcriptional regulator [Corynebacteriales bacterium D3-21]
MNTQVEDGSTDESAQEKASSGRVRTRSGGRSEEVRRAVGRACLSFLAEGRIDFTTVELAERAGVTRKTVYRWWPTHKDLLIEGLSMHVRQMTPPDTGSWESDVREFAHLIAGYAADPVETATSALIASRRFPDFGDLVVEQYRPMREGWQRMVERAAERGDATTEHSPEAVVNALIAPLFLAPLMMGRKATDEEVERTVAIILSATRPPER